MYVIYCRTFQWVMKLAVNFLDWSEPQLLQGANSLRELPALIKSLGLKKLLIVTDRELMRLGLPQPLFQGLEQAGVAFAVFDETCQNPTIENIERARKRYLDESCDALVAFGGGSPMDCAKGVGARLVRPTKSLAQLRGLLKIRRRLPPFFAVPTTAGTGSETTLAAVVTDPEAQEKYPMNDPALRPKYAVLDPLLTIGLPKHITAATGMDALTHAVEAFIGRSNTKNTEARALEAVRLIFANLETVYEDGKNLPAREAMLRASYFAGIAFTRAYVGYCHAVAHKLGGLYHVPHGLANAILLPHVLDYFGESAQARLALLAKAAGIAKQGQSQAELAAAFIEAIRGMNRRMGIPEGFECIREADIPEIIDAAFKEAHPLYPVPKIMTRADCAALLLRLRMDG
ncbi:MAG: iron-containing alcohol dehydrogenase [Oscillospiraceae bacterium]|nr:iron-containing alcohol dehydrogenase [Oscillospiraceae bacterium]